jgi:hypothetical protein
MTSEYENLDWDIPKSFSSNKVKSGGYTIYSTKKAVKLMTSGANDRWSVIDLSKEEAIELARLLLVVTDTLS